MSGTYCKTKVKEECAPLSGKILYSLIPVCRAKKVSLTASQSFSPLYVIGYSFRITFFYMSIKHISMSRNKAAHHISIYFSGCLFDSSFIYPFVECKVSLLACLKGPCHYFICSLKTRCHCVKQISCKLSYIDQVSNLAHRALVLTFNTLAKVHINICIGCFIEIAHMAIQADDNWHLQAHGCICIVDSSMLQWLRSIPKFI